MSRRWSVLALLLLRSVATAGPIHGETTTFHRPDAVATTSRSCRACHTRIYDEWSQSSHAQAFTSPLFQAKYKARRRPKSCLRCHAPNSIWEQGPEALPTPRRHDIPEGVSCISCHRHGEAMVGPHMTPDSAHPTIQDASIRGVGACASCHSGPNDCEAALTGQVHEYLHSPQRGRETCQSCHMPAVMDTSVDLIRPRYPARPGRSHFIQASRDPEVLRLSVTLDAFLEGKYFHVTLENKTAGHRLPGSTGRALVLVTRFTDRRGLEFDHSNEYLMGKTHTRLRPGERREYRYLLKPRYEGVETVLYYRTHEKQSPKEWVRIDRVGLRLDGRGPLPEPQSREPGRRN